MLAALVALSFALQPVRPFADERHLLDRRLEALRRVLPDGPTPAADVATVKELAEAARLAQVEVRARPPAESGTHGELTLDVAALGDYQEIDRFFQKASLSYRLIDVESLTLSATTEDVIRLAAVLRLPYWPARAPLPAPPEAPKGAPAGVPRPTLDAFRRDQALAFAKSDVIAARRRSRRTARLFLSELAAATRDRPLELGFASLGDEFTIRGLTLGEGPLRALESRLERGFFRLSDFLIAKQGACYRFEAHGSSPVAGPDAELPVPVDDPFEQDATPCRVDRDTARVVVVKGRAPTAKDPGKGPLTLRLRDVDLADVFQALARLGFGGYVVDEAVTGRASVEITRATLDEALALLHKTAGVELTPIGPLRRVSLARSPTRPELPAGGPLASFSVKRTDVRDLLAAMAELDPTLASLGPPGFLGRVSVFTRDTPLLALRAAVLESAALSERSEEGRRVVERRTGTSDAPAPIARSGPEPRLALRREDVSLQEFALAGVGSAGQGFLAFAYSPTGQLNAYAPGDRLADAAVRSVEADRVVLETAEGPLQLSLPALSN
ncbi:MAG: hypothetical protein ACM3PV_02135 [Betaproteobacteria bacterium]